MARLELNEISSLVEYVEDATGGILMFKGLYPENFPDNFTRYFEVGGIAPDPRFAGLRRSIAHDWHEAEWYGEGSSGLCYAVLNPIEEDNEFVGEEPIPWSNVIRLFITESSLKSIEKKYLLVQNPSIGWEDFMRRVTVLDNDITKSEFRWSLYKFLEELL